MGLFGNKDKPKTVEVPFATKDQVSGLIKLARGKTMGQMEHSLRSNVKEGRLIFHKDNTDYTDKKGNHGVYTDSQLSAVLWKIFDNALSSGVKYGGMTAGLAMLGITELDIQDIIKKVRGN